MNVHISCVGCEQRMLDAQYVRDFCTVNDIAVVDDPERCECAIVVTCAVDAAKTGLSMSALSAVCSRLPPSARLVVGGCLPSIAPELLNGCPVHSTFSPRDLAESIQLLLGRYSSVPMSRIAYPNRSIWDLGGPPLTEFGSSARADYDWAKRGFKIRIAQGCVGTCSYCAIRCATGTLCSEPVALVADQVRQAASAGEPTVMLLGGDTGAYGRDIGSSFPLLLQEILPIAGGFHLYIHDFGIHWLARDRSAYEPVFALDRGRRKLRSMCLPIQSGSDTILAAMQRPYTAAEIIRTVQWLRLRTPGIQIGTHVIVGFPGETDEDFCRTLGVLELAQFDFLTCFAYSEHSCTLSARLTPKVDRSTTEARLASLRTRFPEAARIVE